MKPVNIRETMAGKPAWTATDGATFWTGAAFNGGSTWVGKFSGHSPWERHPDGDELIYILEGEVEIELLTGSQRTSVAVGTGSHFVIPRGSWHRQKAKGDVVEMGATSGGTDYSEAEDPR